MFRIDRPRASLPALATLILGLSFAQAARAACTLPSNVWPSGAQMQCGNTGAVCNSDSDCMGGTCMLVGTEDASYISLWCNNWRGAELWNGLKLDSGDWDEGFGLEETAGVVPSIPGGPTCHVDHHLTRLMNAGALVYAVSTYSGPYGFHRNVSDWDGKLHDSDLDGAGNFAGKWWDYAKHHIDDEWVPSCEDDFDPVLGTQTTSTNKDGYYDDEIQLHIPGAYRQSAIERAGTVVHETVHADVPHIDGDPCDNKGSCDDQYGRYNAQTLNINFLYDAVTRYTLTEVEGETVHPAMSALDPATGERVCKYIPMLSNGERTRAFGTADVKRDTTFVIGETGAQPTYVDVADMDAKHGKTWSCERCEFSDWEFDPNVCEQTACNELLNPKNAERNDENQVACLYYNLTVSTHDNSEEGIALAQEKYPPESCYAPSPAATEAYCEAQKAAATHVSEIDGCGWLADLGGEATSKDECVQSFCEEKFALGGRAGWSVEGGDPYGCLDYLCAADGEGCGSDLPEDVCRLLVIETHAEPGAYLMSCSGDECQREGLGCLAGILAEDPDAWEYGEPKPRICALREAACQLASLRLFDVYANLKFLIDPYGPLQPIDQVRQPYPAEDVLRHLQELREARAAGLSDEARFEIVARIAKDPELLSQAFALSPGHFVALFGQEGFDETLGPAATRVGPVAITAEDLTPEGALALSELEAYVASTAPEDRLACWGSARLPQAPDPSLSEPGP